MVLRPKVFEFDMISKYSREKDLNIHRFHLQQIRKRKNNYSEINPLSNYVISSRMNALFPEVTHTNHILNERLYGIGHRENKTLQNSGNSPDNSNSSQRQKLAILGISNRKINKENFAFKKRMEATKSIVNVKKLEKEFQQSRNLIKQLRKIHVQSQSVKDLNVKRDECVYFPMLK